MGKMDMPGSTAQPQKALGGLVCPDGWAALDFCAPCCVRFEAEPGACLELDLDGETAVYRIGQWLIQQRRYGFQIAAVSAAAGSVALLSGGEALPACTLTVAGVRNDLSAPIRLVFERDGVQIDGVQPAQEGNGPGGTSSGKQGDTILDALRNIRKELEGRLPEKRRQTAQLRAQVDRLEAEYSQLEAEYASLKEKAETLRAEGDRVAQMKSALQAEMEQYAQMRLRAAAQVRQLDEEGLEQANKRLAEMSAQLADDESVIEALKTDVRIDAPPVSKELKALRGQIEGVEQRVAGLIRVRERIEAAVLRAVNGGSNGLVSDAGEAGSDGD